jgi:ABC-2 type transport system permease protein
MSAPTTTTAVGTTATAGPQLSFGGVLNSEWIKLRTLRSTFWCYLISVVLTILLGLLIASTITHSGTTLPHDVQQSAWVQASTLGIAFAQLVVAVLGALTVTGEYGTGMIRSTFAAVPRRWPAIVAKAIVFGVTTFVVSLVGLVLTALVTAPILSGQGIHADWGDGNVWLSLVGGAGFLALIGVISLAIGLLLRNSAAGIATSLGLVLVLPIIFNLLVGLAKADWAANISAFLPSNAGAKLYGYPVAAAQTIGQGRAPATTAATVDLTNWQALLVLLGWFAVAFAAGLFALRRRDA